jgi:hypothetical protein
MKKVKNRQVSFSAKTISKRTSCMLAALLLVVGLSIPMVVPDQAQAAVELLNNRSLQLSSSAMGNINQDARGVAYNPGDGGDGEKTKHIVKFTFTTLNPTLGALVIMYCTTPVFQTACVTPGDTNGNGTQDAGEGFLSVTTINTSQVTTGLTGTWSTNTSDNTSSFNWANYGTCNGSGTTRQNCVVIQKSTAAASETGNSGHPLVTVTYGGTVSEYATNPFPTLTNSNENYSFYARVIAFNSNTTAGMTVGNIVEVGSTAASTTQQIDITAKVQEILNFSVGATPVDKGAGATSCVALGSTATDTGAITLGDVVTGVLSTALAYDKHSYFRINTNTVNGTVITYSADTLKTTSGTQQIDAMPVVAGPVGTASSPGTKQFGLSIDPSDTDPDANAGTADGFSFTDLAGTGDAPYNAGNGTLGSVGSPGTAKFALETTSITAPKQIAHSTGGITCDTGSVRYVANVSTNTAAGIYRTTVTYIATGTY